MKHFLQNSYDKTPGEGSECHEKTITFLSHYGRKFCHDIMLNRNFYKLYGIAL